MTTYTGTAGNDTITGTRADDLFYGTTGTDILNGGAGNDTFQFIIETNSNDRIDGGTGLHDLIDLSIIGRYLTSTTNLFDTVTNLTTGNFYRYGTTTTAVDHKFINNVEDVSGSNYRDSIIGNDDANTFHGGNGNDTLDGQANNDILFGDAGNDRLLGGIGNDTLYGGDGSDNLDGGVGNDIINGGNGNDIIKWSAGNDNIDGGTGIDTFDFKATTNTYANFGASLEFHFPNGSGASAGFWMSSVTDLTAGTYQKYDSLNQNVETSHLTSIENVTGSNYSDWIRGDSNDNVITGNGSSLTSNGVDILEGKGGNDTIYTGSNGYSLGGDGNDIIYSGNNTDSTWHLLAGNAGDDTIYGGSGNDNIIGDSGSGVAGIIFSEPSNYGNYLLSDSGNDTLYGGAGNDKIDGGNGNDFVSGDDGNDTIWDLSGDNVLNGGDGNDIIYTGVGADIVNGGNGDDLINKHFSFFATGAASFTGGAGNDTFVFSFYGMGSGSSTGTMHATITDFNTAQDTLDLPDVSAPWSSYTFTFDGTNLHANMDYNWSTHHTYVDITLQGLNMSDVPNIHVV